MGVASEGILSLALEGTPRNAEARPSYSAARLSALGVPVRSRRREGAPIPWTGEDGVALGFVTLV